MDFDRANMKQIVLTIRGRNGETFAAVKYPDDTCGVELNGERIGCFSWPGEQADRCTSAMRTIAQMGED